MFAGGCGCVWLVFLTTADVVGFGFLGLCVLFCLVCGRTGVTGCELRWVAEGSLVLGGLGLW